jgi:tetratricopeptide (TPR) repeat protein
MNKWTRRLELSRASAGPAGSHPAPPSHHYFAFLSYSHDDSEEADRLHRELEEFRVPLALRGRLTANGVIPKRLSPIFRDRHELAAGQDLTQEIRGALSASRCLIVLCSPAAAKSKWTNREIEFFRRAHPDGCIIAAIVAGDPLAKGDQGCFPPALLQKYDRLGRPTGKAAEPLAADLRESGDGRRIGLLKIVAGILGVGLDDLVQRDHLRRQRRLAIISAASLIGMLIAIALAVTAIRGRDAARDQRRQAESLIGFMLGDLKDKLEPIGKLDVLDGVGSRILSYYGNQDTSQLSDAGLAQRSKALTLMGRIAQSRGNLDAADKFLTAALTGSAESMRRSPDDPQRIFEHAQNVFWMGELARNRGQTAQSDDAYREYKRLADQMIAIEPDNLRWRLEEAYADENIGIIEFNHRRFDEAAESFQGSLRFMMALDSIGPDVGASHYDIANTIGWAADAERARGQLKAAIALRKREIAYLSRSIAGGASGVELYQPLLVSHLALGILLRETGQTDESLAELHAAVAEADRLLGVEARNALWKRFGAASRLELAKTLLSTNRREEAADQAKAGCDLVASLPSAEGASSRARIQNFCLTMQSRLAFAGGDNASALALATQGLASARAIWSNDPIADRYIIAGSYRLVGDIHQRMGHRDAARAAWAAGANQLPSNVNERPIEMLERAQLLDRLGRSDEARRLFAKLQSIGYRDIS